MRFFPDAILSLTKHEEENAFVVESTLRDFKAIDPFVVKWEYPLLVPDERLNPEKLKTALAKKPVYNVKDLLMWVAQETMSTKALKERVMEETGISKSLFYELLAELKKTAGVTYDEEAKTWSYEIPIPSREG